MSSVKKFVANSSHPLGLAAQAAPMLSAEEELAAVERGDTDLLFRSHLRLALKIAVKYRGYRLSMDDIISESCIGLTKAIARFKPDKGVRLATYAIWWCRAACQEFVLSNARMVKLGTTAAGKKLFFHKGEIWDGTAEDVAERLNVPVADVESMRIRLQSEQSLNAPVTDDGENCTEWIDLLEDDTPNTEEKYIQEEHRTNRMAQLAEALATLSERGRDIITRRAKDEPDTLETLATDHGISRERVRQIEVASLHKLRQVMGAQRRKAGPDGVRPGASTGRRNGGGVSTISKGVPASKRRPTEAQRDAHRRYMRDYKKRKRAKAA